MPPAAPAQQTDQAAGAQDKVKRQETAGLRPGATQYTDRRQQRPRLPTRQLHGRGRACCHLPSPPSSLTPPLPFAFIGKPFADKCEKSA